MAIPSDPSSNNSSSANLNSSTEFEKPFDKKNDANISFNSNSKRKSMPNTRSNSNFSVSSLPQNDSDRMSISTNSNANFYPPLSYSETPVVDRYMSTSTISNDENSQDNNSQTIPLPNNTTRAEKARLIIAGFSPILDEKGKKPVQIGNVLNEENSNYVDLFSEISLDLEESSLLRLNDIWITLMGVTFYQPLFGITGIYILFIVKYDNYYI